MRTLLRLMTWLSPGFPVGGFGYSHGLERAIEVGLAGDRAAVVEWVATVLTHGSGRQDAALLLEAHRRHDDASRLDRVVEWADALRGTAELARESASQGQAFLDTVRAAWPDRWLEAWQTRLHAQERRPAYAVAVGAVAARAGLAEEATLAAYLHAFAANLVSAAVRLIPLGHTDGQKAMAALEAPVTAAATAALVRSFDDLGTATAMVDWCSQTHETQYTRLFRS